MKVLNKYSCLNIADNNILDWIYQQWTSIFCFYKQREESQFVSVVINSMPQILLNNLDNFVHLFFIYVI